MSAPRAVSPARHCAYVVTRRVFEQGAYADRALTAEAAALAPRDRALATALAYTTVQRRVTLDHVLAQLSDRPIDRLDPGVLAALRLGVTQLLLLDGIADHAAVHESVELAKRDTPGAGGFVNAVLRRATREGDEILAGLHDATPVDAAILHSVPEWLAQLWFDELGGERARSLLAAMNRPAESALRVNALVATVDEVAGQLAELGVAARRAGGAPDGLVLDGPFDAHGSALFARGAIMPQSRGSMLPAALLAPAPGQRVLDVCAAPGAKTGQLAALMGDRGTLHAVERHPGRAQALRRTLARLHVTCAEVQVGDAATIDLGSQVYDRVLVDPPCSGLGTLRSRPDLRWRTSAERVAALPAVQSAILRAAAARVASGGELVYSVCTISRAEGEGVVVAFLAGNPEFGALPVGVGEPFIQTAPDTDATDGFFIARLVRE